MEYRDTLNVTREIISQVTGLSPEELDEDASLAQDVGISSLELMLIQSKVEKQFKTSFNVRELRTVSSLRDYVELIRSHQHS